MQRETGIVSLPTQERAIRVSRNQLSTSELFVHYIKNVVSPPVWSLYRMERRKRMFFKWLVLGKDGVDDLGHKPAYSTDDAISVAMTRWDVEHRVFAVGTVFFRNSVYSVL
jgi:hypothetical protein